MLSRWYANDDESVQPPSELHLPIVDLSRPNAEAEIAAGMDMFGAVMVQSPDLEAVLAKGKHRATIRAVAKHLGEQGPCLFGHLAATEAETSDGTAYDSLTTIATRQRRIGVRQDSSMHEEVEGIDAAATQQEDEADLVMTSGDEGAPEAAQLDEWRPPPGIREGVMKLDTDLKEAVYGKGDLAGKGTAGRKVDGLAYLAFGKGSSCHRAQALHVDAAAPFHQSAQNVQSAVPWYAHVSLQDKGHPVLMVKGSHKLVALLATLAQQQGVDVADRVVSQMMRSMGPEALTPKRVVVPQGLMLLMHGNTVHSGDGMHEYWGSALRAHLTLQLPDHVYPTYGDSTFTLNHMAPDLVSTLFAQQFVQPAVTPQQFQQLREALNRERRGMGTEGTYGSLTVDDMSTVFSRFPDFSSHSVFVDVGSGMSKPQLQALVEFGVTCSVGVEFDENKCLLAVDFIQTMRRQMGVSSDVVLKVVHGGVNAGAHHLTTLEPGTHVLLCWKGWSAEDKEAVGQLVASSSSVAYVCIVDHRQKVGNLLTGFPPMELISQDSVKLRESDEAMVAWVFKVKGRPSRRMGLPVGGVLELPQFHPASSSMGRGKRNACKR